MLDPIRPAVCRYCGDEYVIRDQYCYGQDATGRIRRRLGHAAGYSPKKVSKPEAEGNPFLEESLEREA